MCNNILENLIINVINHERFSRHQRAQPVNDAIECNLSDRLAQFEKFYDPI